jgi:uncharacterized membrane protein
VGTFSSSFSIRLAGLGMIVAAVGCAGNLTAASHGRGAGQWSVRLPNNDRSVASLAYGRGGNSERAAISSTDSQPSAAAKPTRVTQPARKLVAARAATAAPSPVVAAPATPTAAEPVQLAMADEPSADQLYAARESQSRQLENFKGGSAIIIGTTTLIIVVVVLLLIVLLL